MRRHPRAPRPAAPAASVSGSAVRSSPSSTTAAPPTSSRSTGRVGPNASAATGSAMPACAGPERSHSAMSASAPGRQVAELVLAAEAARAVASGELEHLAGGQRVRAVLDAGEHQRGAQLVDELARLVRGGAVDAEADRRARREQLRHGRDAGPEPPVRGRAVRDAGAGVAHPLRLARVEVDAVREPDVLAEPAELLDVLERAHAEALEAERLLVDRLGEVGVEPDAARASQLRRLRHQLAGHAERRGGGERDPHHRARRRVVEAVDRRRRRRRGSRRGPRRGRRAGGRRRSRRGPSRRGRGGSAARSRARRRSRRRAGRPRRAGRCSGGRSRSCSPRWRARRARRGRRRRPPRASIRCQTG